MNTRRMNNGSVRWLLTTWLLLAMILTLAGPAASVAQGAGYVVTNLNDSGPGSLRQAIVDANAAAGADTITFSVSGTISLISSLPDITDAAGLIIDGPGQKSITLSGNNAVRVMIVNSGGWNCVNNGTLSDGGGNLSWSDTTCPGLNADPLLGPLQDNGGPTQTHALLAGSPAIDAALLANCPAADQRGVSRPQGSGCDIGAYEIELD